MRSFLLRCSKSLNILYIVVIQRRVFIKLCALSPQMQYNVYIIGVNIFIITTAFVQSAIDDNILSEKSIFTCSFTQHRFE